MKIDLNKKALLQDELDRAGCHEEASKIAAEFLMEAEKSDYCSCPNKKCPIHGNCFYCVQIHRGHGGHLPYCMFEMVNERLAGIASLTEGTLKSYMSKHPDVCSGIPIHKSSDVDEQHCFITNACFI